MTKQDKLELIIEKLASGKRSQFAIMIGETPSNISKWLSRNTFDADLLLTTFPDLSAEWLMRDKGPMLLSEQNKKLETDTLDLTQALDLIRSQAQTIENLHKLLSRYLEETKHTTL